MNARNSLLALLAVAVCACASTPPPARDIVAEARQFMAAYGAELAAADREAVAARYDRRGNYMIFEGRLSFSTHDETAADYRDRWRPPAAFAWQELTYDPIGDDAVVVMGRFLWTRAGEQDAKPYSYTAVLVRDAASGALRIRVENEFGADR